MQALLGDRWVDGLLDYHRAPGEARVRVTAWRVICPLGGLYFVRPRSSRMVAAYAREIGVRETLRKVASRTQEGRRNEKVLSCGVGVIEEVDEAPEGLRAGDRVVFVAPAHPPCADRLSLPLELLAPAGSLGVPERPGWLLHRDADPDVVPPDWGEVPGWSPQAGRPLGQDAADAVAQATALLARTDWTGATWRPTPGSSPAREASQPRLATPRPRRRKRATLFGYGNYAKTAVLPNVRRHIDVRRIHEIDPTQVPAGRRRGAIWDTAPRARDDDAADVWLIAGYHHSHAALAVAALDRGIAAVVEKPVVTTLEQLDALVAAMERSPAPLYSCFQRRYIAFNDLARRDLDAPPGTPISYHCIVYEVPLPPLHWYRWPSSRSRLVSNGCHWIDHCLFLNGYCEVTGIDVIAGADGSLNASMQLANGASFTMVLTDRGSPRIGVQDHVELRTDAGTARIVNTSHYRAERPNGDVRRERMNKTRAYGIMYRAIAEDVARGGRGDTVEAVRVSAGAVLALEAEFSAAQAEPNLGDNY